MAERDSGRPPPEAFHTVTDPQQAKLLSDLESFRYLEPFIAQERTVSQAAEEVGCKLDTMLYRIRKFLAAGLLMVSRTEKRVGRPIKHYRSAHDAYFIPFEVTPYAGLEERLAAQYREQQAFIVPIMAKSLRKMGKEGRRVFRRLDDGEVWQESASDIQTFVNLYDPQGYQTFMESYRGSIAEFMNDDLALTDEEAKELLTALYGVWRRFHFQDGKQRNDGQTRRFYFLQFTLLPLEP